MIMQRRVTYKTAAATLTYAEMGDIVVNSDSDATITLPAPNKGLWYRLSNVGTGVVTVYYGSALTTLKQTEQALMLANGTSGYWMSKGSGAMTKEEIEGILTGEITSHYHPNPDDMGIADLTDVPDYATSGGKILAVKADASGVEYVTPAQAANGIPSGGITNQLFAKKSDADYDGKWVDAPESANGLPAGGTAGQMLSKVDGTDYNAEWVDASNGGDTISKRFDWSYRGDNRSTSAYAWKGNRFKPDIETTLYALEYYGGVVAGASYQAAVITITNGTVATIVKSKMVTLPASLASTDGGFIFLEFESPVILSVGTDYGLLIGRTDGGDTYALPLPFDGGTTTKTAVPMPGKSHGNSARITKASPSVGDPVDTSFTGSIGMGFYYST